MKIGDKVRNKDHKSCGIDGLVLFWDYRGTLIKIWDVPEYIPEPGNHWAGEYKAACTRAKVYRNNNPNDWFCCNLEDLELDV